jgi:G3E family GTPase
MEEVKEAVNTTESAPVEATQEVVNQSAPTDQTEATQPEQETAQTQPAGQQSYEAVDEFGVPYKNRAFEWKRKHEETIDKLPSLIEEAVKSSVQQYGQAPQRKYTVAELESFAQQSPEHRPWVEEQKSLLLREQLTNEFEQRIKAVETKKEAEIRRQNSFSYVASNYPDVFVKNQQGQIMGINNQSPMAQQINVLMNDPRFANDPEGLVAAADIAYARVTRSQQGINLMKEQKLKAEVKHLQKQTMVEGGARQGVQAIPEYRKAIDKAKQSGSLRDTAEALKAIAKAKRESMEK